MLEELTKPQLLTLAKENNVEAEYTMTKAKIIGALEDSGVEFVKPNNVITTENLEARDEPDVAEPAAEEDYPAEETRSLVKYTGSAETYQRRNYKFGKAAPFRLVDKGDVDSLLKYDCFRLASPREVEEFYS